MTNIQWDSEASLMRVTTFSTTDPQEELVGRGVLRELVGAFLEMDPSGQEGLLLRAAGPDWIQEYDEHEIRELAARPEYSSAHGAFDTADLPDDPEASEEIDVLVSESGASDATAGRFGDAEHGTA
ncbi:MAG: hypothetical protein JWL91_2737 [Sphingomonas bacterium]|jgi:hypothetical protein|nr:hypothetical protein [Sphingomonas bacterium]MDB5690861.1 hypothetical protein [Sphingomonas bacterium]